MLVFVKILCALLMCWFITRSAYGLGRLEWRWAAVRWLFALTFIGSIIPFYYAHVIDFSYLYYEFRTLAYVEYLVVFIPALPVYLAAQSRNSAVTVVTIIASFAVCSLPFTKPLLSRIESPNYTDHWVGNICMQSTPSSCGPASVASIMKGFGDVYTEAEVAERAYTYSGGTEAWHLARFLEDEGYVVDFLDVDRKPNSFPVPCMLGVQLGDFGHFIPVLSYKNGKYTVGDPLIGRISYTIEQLEDEYELTGFCMQIEKQRSASAPIGNYKKANIPSRKEVL